MEDNGSQTTSVTLETRFFKSSIVVYIFFFHREKHRNIDHRKNGVNFVNKNNVRIVEEKKNFCWAVRRNQIGIAYDFFIPHGKDIFFKSSKNSGAKNLGYRFD